MNYKPYQSEGNSEFQALSNFARYIFDNPAMMEVQEYKNIYLRYVSEKKRIDNRRSRSETRRGGRSNPYTVMYKKEEEESNNALPYIKCKKCSGNDVVILSGEKAKWFESDCQAVMCGVLFYCQSCNEKFSIRFLEKNDCGVQAWVQIVESNTDSKLWTPQNETDTYSVDDYVLEVDPVLVNIREDSDE